MQSSIRNEQTEQRAKVRNQIKTAFGIVLGIAAILSAFFPYIQFVFKNQIFTVTGLQLITTRGMRVQGPELSGLVTIPLLMRAAVLLGLLLPILGILLLCLKKAVWAGAMFTLSAITPLLILIATSGIQEAVTQLNVSEVRIRYMWPFAVILFFGLFSGILSLSTQGTEKLAESIFLVFSCVSIGSVLMITIYIFAMGVPALSKIGLFQFLLGREWAVGSEKFGILPMILSSIAGTVGAIVLGVPVGLFTAVFLSEISSPKIASIVRPAIELLAGIPSVIYGFFGMLIIVPAIRNFPLFKGKTIGDSLLAAILILAIMILPTIVSVAETSLKAVPPSFREASLALGATPVATIFKVTLPAAKSGILAGVILGVGRAIGETMAVIMVAGNVPNMPQVLGSVRLLTTGIAMEMSYASGLHRQALFAIGLVLFVFIMIVNISFTYISRKGVQMDAK